MPVADEQRKALVGLGLEQTVNSHDSS
jgi:hypothetical protein